MLAGGGPLPSVRISDEGGRFPVAHARSPGHVPGKAGRSRRNDGLTELRRQGRARRMQSSSSRPRSWSRWGAGGRHRHDFNTCSGIQAMRRSFDWRQRKPSASRKKKAIESQPERSGSDRQSWALPGSRYEVKPPDLNDLLRKPCSCSAGPWKDPHLRAVWDTPCVERFGGSGAGLPESARNAWKRCPGWRLHVRRPA
jgi:hypothetical protein